MNAEPRVLAGTHESPLSLAQHESLFGPSRGLHLEPAELKASGLTGRGGAGVPTSLKVEFLRQQKRSVGYVVVNAMEGEPAAHKDRTLLSKNPHLVLDGAMVLANMLGADDVVPEEFVTSIEIFALVLRTYNMPQEFVTRKAEQVRREGYALLRRSDLPVLSGPMEK